MERFNWLYRLFSLILVPCAVVATLLFPASSVLQITSSVSAPVLIPGRKLFLDWGLQMNYDLPSTPMQFYNVPIWPNILSKRKRSYWECSANCTVADILAKDKYDWSHRDSRHPNDFSAGELYHSFENLLVSYGFHETCLLRSVCELARHPFANEQRNILTEMLTFILTPSLHEAFADSEVMYREVYEAAELRGFLGGNCSSVFYDCKVDLLTAITKVID